MSITVPVFVTADAKNGLVPVIEAARGVPITVFADPALSVNSCVPVRVASPGERAVPVIVIAGSLSDGLQFVEGGPIGFVEGGVIAGVED